MTAMAGMFLTGDKTFGSFAMATILVVAIANPTNNDGDPETGPPQMASGTDASRLDLGFRTGYLLSHRVLGDELESAGDLGHGQIRP